jgi:hypothetical protein
MRKIWLIVVASSAVIAFAPATALAKRHHHSHVHHTTVHRKIFGSDAATTPGQPGTTPGTGTQSAGPAGTVQSFTGGVLTILLTNGSTVSGQVANNTQISCGSSQSGHDSQDQGQGGNGGSNDTDDQSQSGNPGQGDDDQGDNGSSQTCTSSDLVQGAGVQEAVLSLTSSGPVWTSVDLVPSSSTTPGTTPGSSSSGSDE